MSPGGPTGVLSSMNDEFRQLEDDHEAGLYWLYPNSRLLSCWTGDWAGSRHALDISDLSTP